MAILATLFGGSGPMCGRGGVRAAALEWVGGLFLVSSLVGLGFDLARSVG